MREDKRNKYKVGKSVKEAIYQLGGVTAIAEASDVLIKSTLYKYLNGSSKYIMTGNANKIANALKLKPIFDNDNLLIELELKEATKPQLIKPNYCFNCGHKM